MTTPVSGGCAACACRLKDFSALLVPTENLFIAAYIVSFSVYKTKACYTSSTLTCHIFPYLFVIDWYRLLRSGILLKTEKLLMCSFVWTAMKAPLLSFYVLLFGHWFYIITVEILLCSSQYNLTVICHKRY